MRFNTDAPAAVEEKPELQLIGTDGNAFAIFGRAMRVARKAGWSQDYIDAIMKEARSSDYDHVLNTMRHYFDVC